MVIFVINSANKRLDGPSSSFSKSLRALKAHNLVDDVNPNLIVVGTQAISMGCRKEKYQNTARDVTDIVRRCVYKESSIEDVPVVFVENEPDDCGLSKSEDGDFYWLPDGQLSHANLMNEMHNVFRQNEDKLALLLTSWYFRPDCPDRKSKAVVEILEDHPAVDINEQIKLINNLMDRLRNGYIGYSGRVSS